MDVSLLKKDLLTRDVHTIHDISVYSRYICTYLDNEFLSHQDTASLPDILHQNKPSREELATLLDWLSNLQIMYITLSFVPRYKFIAEMHNALMKKYQTEFVLDIDTDPSIGAGISIKYNGKNDDATFKKFIQDYAI